MKYQGYEIPQKFDPAILESIDPEKPVMICQWIFSGNSIANCDNVDGCNECLFGSPTGNMSVPYWAEVLKYLDSKEFMFFKL